MRSWLRAHGPTLGLSVACAALSLQVVLLARQNRALKAAGVAPSAEAHPLGDAAFRVGDPFPAFAWRAPDGALHEVELGPGREDTLLFVLADACPVCPQVVPRWEEIAPFFVHAGTRVLGLLLDRPEADGPEWFEGVPLGSFADLSRLPLAKLRTVPLTLLIDGTGAIEWLHYGTLTDARLEELMLHLP